MDGGGIGFEEFHDCLQTLARINVLTLAYRPTLRWLRQFRGEGLTLLDAGSGGGDMLRKIAGRMPGFTLRGLDLNPWSKKSAESLPFAGIRHDTGDIFDIGPSENIDLIISSLFTHHLTEEQLVNFLRWMEKTATRGWFVNDLHRHWLPYHFIKHAVKISRNRLIRHDAPVSVARAFTRSDWQRLLAAAGLAPGAVSISWCFPFRYCLSRVKA